MGNWDHISGQDTLKQYFSQVAENKKISHAYILEGEPGTPKKELAGAFARMLQCENGNGCGECHSCRAFDSGNHPDIIYVTHEKQDIIRIDEIRDQLVNDIGIRPYSSPYKIYIVDEADKMNVAAQNALLKTLEEPPYYGIIILLTVNSSYFLPTILSRSMVLKLENHSSGVQLLEETQRTKIVSVLNRAWSADRTDMAEAAALWKEMDVPIQWIMNVVRIWLRDVLVWKECKDRTLLILQDEIRGIQTAAENYTFAQLNRILLLVDRTEKRIVFHVSFELAVEELLAAMRGKKQEDEDSWEDSAPFPDFEEARFLNESYENAMQYSGHQEE
ncbi:MAG: DNA polymerase III subunit delta' C-terminal domain-containing protein [Clostridiales bacterium]|nr:DNA polymerase III subunit delta' C-terminal domain-containing protein [Clostridiales bacterium]